MLSVICNARGNRLLENLPEPASDYLLEHLEPVWLSLGKVLSEPGRRVGDVYFPTSAIVSLLGVLGDGTSTQVAMIGNEGLVGVAAFLGGGTLPCRAVVQTAGWAYRLNEQPCSREVDDPVDFERLFLPYSAALLAQVGQTVACNRHHSIDQRLCRWLLLNLDRLSSNTIITTQGRISAMLGVRREGVTEAIGKLKHAGLIAHSRGRISVLDRAGLQAQTCECYEVVRDECRRLLGDRLNMRSCSVYRTHAAPPSGPVSLRVRDRAQGARLTP